MLSLKGTEIMSNTIAGSSVSTVVLNYMSNIHNAMVLTPISEPLAEILGTYSCAGESYFNGPLSWSATFEKDEKELDM